MFQVLDVSIDVNSMNMIRNKAENQHTQTQLKWRSLCAPLDIVPLLFLSFFSVFGLSLFFWEYLTFSFSFFDIFSSLRRINDVTIENMALNKWKAWPVENSEDVLKIDKKLVTTKRGSCDQFFAKIKIFEPDEAQ